MRIGLVVNQSRDSGYRITQKIVHYLRARSVEVVVDPAHHPDSLCQISGITPASYKTCDLILSLGGDGTLLSAARYTHGFHLPIAGVNLGSMGFMTEIEVCDLERALAAILSNDFTIDERMQLAVTCYNADGEQVLESFALNDAVLSRAPFERIVTYGLFIDGEEVESIPGDGVILSTPTGSTGYALAAGGSIIDAHLQTIQITPLCPHTLHNRSYVVKADSCIRVEIQTVDTRAYLALDGRETALLGLGSWLEVRRHPLPLQRIELEHKPFFSRIPEKINQRTVKERERRENQDEKE